MPKYGPELEPTPSKAKTDSDSIARPKTNGEPSTDMQDEIKRVADEESKKPFGGNMRSAMNKMKAMAAKADEIKREGADYRTNRLEDQTAAIKRAVGGQEK
jgi:hypothetical protein